MNSRVSRDTFNLLRIAAWPMINMAESARLAGLADFA
jgi:hypothetical protein